MKVISMGLPSFTKKFMMWVTLYLTIFFLQLRKDKLSVLSGELCLKF